MNRTRTRRRFLWLTPLVLVLGLYGCGQSGKKLDVSVALDFGPAERPRAEKTVAVALGSTVFEALRAAFPVATSGR
jgi:predicted small lipoprotein YifL